MVLAGFCAVVEEAMVEGGCRQPYGGGFVLCERGCLKHLAEGFVLCFFPYRQDAVSNEDNNLRRTQCWVDVIGGKKKGRVHGARQLAANYTSTIGGTLKNQPSSSTTTANEIAERLTQLIQRDQENRDLRDEYSSLRDKFTNFKSLVMRALFEASHLHSTVPPT
ncbi:hypothetical protein LR48_Vigan10g137000 [Vigna angularis]|uniref:Uncharacterized protein n=1 Tax=Phaseolus angularis TaxID=3914 RepID=A0A0L9VKI7_PHAAN|nr:hypothetical protein LR48_Vigan10g137000 [Vigna angularis]